ncbi:MAG TPA: hypothetical protein VNT57_01860 [Desulfobacteria bacterium]|nr:hypothetical protein [Desulfobacteria bacterium]
MDKITAYIDKITKFFGKVPEKYWYIALGLIVVIVLAFVGYKVYEKFMSGEDEDLEEKIEQLKTDLQSRYGSSKYAKSVIEMEVAAFKKTAQLKTYANEAGEQNDTEKVRLLEEQVRQIETLLRELRESALRHEEAEAKLRSIITNVQPPHGKRAMRLLTGQILLIRHLGKYAAVQAIDQASADRGGYIRYVWWYQPDGSGVFTAPETLTGFGETGEGKGNQLEIGPLKLSWSKSDDGTGWVYFGPTIVPSPDFELAYTSETDIAKIDAAAFVFLKPERDEDDEDEEEEEQ